MNIELTPIEARIIGCLIEKEVTTPDYYPLTLNSLTTACNQKSNREPVMALSEAEVMDSAQALIDRRLMTDESGFNSRVSKFRHRFCNTEFGSLQLTDQERGIICCMLLRGAQTPGEIRTRTNRLCDFSDVKQVESLLEKMASREEGGLVVKLPRDPGKRESRYQHLFCGEVDVESYATAMPSAALSANSQHEERIATLEQQVSELKAQVEELKALISD
ncbi:YceH family protein [Vibrio rumoiensis]|uniref:YceH family protein n=1 Tax=Vibrio rumoiensis TaxID=76258 RepID=UPI003AA94DAB